MTGDLKPEGPARVVGYEDRSWIEVVGVIDSPGLFTIKVFGREWGNEDFSADLVQQKLGEIETALSLWRSEIEKAAFNAGVEAAALKNTECVADGKRIAGEEAAAIAAAYREPGCVRSCSGEEITDLIRRHFGIGEKK